MKTFKNPESNPIKLVYLIGTYPELTNTFIDREIAMLRQLGDFIIQIVSIRYPHTIDSCSPDQKALCAETFYLIPAHWSEFNFPAFILANLFFIFSQPLVYFRTYLYLARHARPGIKAWTMAILYFWQGVYAAYRLRDKDFDHIHVHFMDRGVLVALVVGRLLGKTYSFTAHAADIYTRAAFVREKIDNAQFVITVSQYNKFHFLKAYPGINAEKIHILHPWVDVSQFVPGPSHPAHARLHVISVGRLVEKKGHSDLIDAIRRLTAEGIDSDCRVVGEGPLRAELVTQIAQDSLQDRIQLLGGLPQSQVMDLLKEWADVFVLPCVIAKNGDRDGIPVSLAEAMALEIPVISTDIVGICELVKPGSGILVAPHDPAALAEALRMVATQGQPAAIRMGCVGREIVNDEFNLFKGTQQLAGYFNLAVNPIDVTGKESVSHVSI
jgi:glycosyltransferase involved in cell wall biosynthesis